MAMRGQTKANLWVPIGMTAVCAAMAAWLTSCATAFEAARFTSEIKLLDGERWWGGGGGDGQSQPYGAGDSRRIDLRTHGMWA